MFNQYGTYNYNSNVSPDDLLLAIKQVAKELAQSVKQSQNITKSNIQITQTERSMEREKAETSNLKNMTVSNDLLLSNDLLVESSQNIERKNLVQKNLSDKENLQGISQSNKNLSNININVNQENFSDDEDFEPKGERLVIKNNNRYLYENDYGYEPTVNKTFYEREVDAHNNLQHRLELMRNKKIAEEMKKLNQRPKMSQTTKKIIKEKFSEEKPIYQRVDDVIKQRTEKMELLKELYKQIETMEENENMTRYNNSFASKEVVEKFIQDQFFWQKTKEEKLAMLRWEFEQAEEEACKTLYKPEISKNSEILAKNKFNKVKDQQVHDRLYNHHEELISKKDKMQSRGIPSFTPVITKNVPKFGKKEIVTKNDLINKKNKIKSGENKNLKINQNAQNNNKEYYDKLERSNKSHSNSFIEQENNFVGRSSSSNFRQSKLSVYRDEEKFTLENKQNNLDTMSQKKFRNSSSTNFNNLEENYNRSQNQLPKTYRHSSPVNDNLNFHNNVFDNTQVEEKEEVQKMNKRLSDLGIKIKNLRKDSKASIDNQNEKKLDNRAQAEGKNGTSSISNISDKERQRSSKLNEPEAASNRRLTQNQQIAQQYNEPSFESESLYKLNVRNASAWSKVSENKLVATPKFNVIVKNLK
jgi:hypothetical protein